MVKIDRGSRKAPTARSTAAGPLDPLLDSLAVEYAAVAGRSCDWEREARRFGIDAGDLFVVLLHEAAYEGGAHPPRSMRR